MRALAGVSSISVSAGQCFNPVPQLGQHSHACFQCKPREQLHGISYVIARTPAPTPGIVSAAYQPALIWAQVHHGHCRPGQSRACEESMQRSSLTLAYRCIQ